MLWLLFSYEFYPRFKSCVGYSSQTLGSERDAYSVETKLPSWVNKYLLGDIFHNCTGLTFYLSISQSRSANSPIWMELFFSQSMEKYIRGQE